jgi:hypothetical protein
MSFSEALALAPEFIVFVSRWRPVSLGPPVGLFSPRGGGDSIINPKMSMSMSMSMSSATRAENALSRGLPTALTA